MLFGAYDLSVDSRMKAGLGFKPQIDLLPLGSSQASGEVFGMMLAM